MSPSIGIASTPFHFSPEAAWLIYILSALTPSTYATCPYPPSDHEIIEFGLGVSP